MYRTTDEQRVISLLRQLGCNEREVQIYLHCVRTGPGSVQNIARQMKQNRVTVHSATQQLIDKGFLYETRRGKKRFVAAEDPASLHGLIQKQENELELMRANVDYVAKVLASMQTKDMRRPTVKFYEGVDGFKFMLEETLSANRRKTVYVFTYVDLFSRLIGADYLEGYFARRAAKGISTRLIFPPCPFATRVNARASEYRIEVRLLPAEMQWKSGIFSWDDTVAVMSYTEGKLTTTIIENVDIAHFYQSAIFELCWNQAKPM